MRMRKKKWAEPWIKEHNDYIYVLPVDKKGNWHKLLNCQELHLEIGMGKGDYIIGMSNLYPDCGWVGMEKDISAAATAARKVIDNEYDINNNRMIYDDAINLENWFDENEVDVIHLNFSDPWPKKHYHKRRLTSDIFLNIYKKILKVQGQIIMKTDNQDLFDYSKEYLLNNNFNIIEENRDYRSNKHEEDVITEYENKFISLGMPIYRLVAIKNDKIV